MARPTSPSPKNTSSFSPRNEPSCERSWLNAAYWRRTPRAAIFTRRQNSEPKKGREIMPVTSADKRTTFRKMHESGCFVLPNPWDVGSARALQHLGFKAIASTSAGFAWSIGKADNRVTVEDVLAHLTALCGAVDLPVNADFEGGFAHKPEKVAANVARAVGTGVAGLSIEDSTGDAAKPLYDRALAVERIRAARAAIDADNGGVLLTGRCEGFLVGQDDLNM